MGQLLEARVLLVVLVFFVHAEEELLCYSDWRLLCIRGWASYCCPRDWIYL